MNEAVMIPLATGWFEIMIVILSAVITCGWMGMSRRAPALMRAAAVLHPLLRNNPSPAPVTRRGFDTGQTPTTETLYDHPSLHERVRSFISGM
jgi:hypothetical protein